jgi:hypothetical protein
MRSYRPAVSPGDRPVEQGILLARARADVVDDQRAAGALPVGDEADVGGGLGEERREDVPGLPARRVAWDRKLRVLAREPDAQVGNAAVIDVAVGRGRAPARRDRRG